MPGRYSSIDVAPAQGGALITRGSAERAGLYNYVLKRDWRRDLDQEIRSEGADYFYPNGSIAIGGQPFPGQIPVTLALAGIIVTATNLLGHHFENGENIIISGSSIPGYNGTFPISAVTATTFQFTVPIGTAAPAGADSILACPDEVINLITEVRRPNGKTAVIAGSARRLYRYFALENGAYFSTSPSDYPIGQTAQYFSTNPADYFGQLPAEYFNDNPGFWIVIGSGFSTSGRRWESVDINGWLVLNNGVDLPMTYQEQDISVVPIYELREQGIASVGTISSVNGILMCADLSEVFESQMPSLMGFLQSSPAFPIPSTENVLAMQSGNTVTTPVDFFDATMVGKTVIWPDGTSASITAFTDARTITVGGGAMTRTNVSFNIRCGASQLGSTFSGLTTASMTHGTQTVTSSGAFFNLGMVNQMIRFSNGFFAHITAFTNPTTVQVDTVLPGLTDILGLPFWIVNDQNPLPNAYTVASDSDFFSADMVGLHIIWDTGEVRKITAFTDATHVQVDDDNPVSDGLIALENTASYAAYTDSGHINRTQYRLAIGMPDLPRRWGASVAGSGSPGSYRVNLSTPALSFEVGQGVTIVGAGQSGGNLTAKITNIGQLGSVLWIDTPILSRFLDQAVEQTDAIASTVGFEDLQGDSSAILKMLPIANTLVIYKDTDIFLAQYTGSTAQPFVFTDLNIQESRTLYYRNTLVCVEEQYHIFAGRNAFYRFDLSSQVPVEIQAFELSSDIFYGSVTLAQTEQVFACDNFITKTVSFVFPSSGSDQAIRYDYFQNTISTTSFAVTSGATIKRPVAGGAIGATEDWHVMGTSHGAVLIYGRTEENQTIPDWNSGNQIFFRRFANPYDAAKVAYESRIKSGLIGFANNFTEKDARSFVPLLSSESGNHAVTVNIYGVRNPSEIPALLVSAPLPSPSSGNLVAMLLRQNYFQDELVVTGTDNPVRISGKTWEVSGVGSKSFIRHT